MLRPATPHASDALAVARLSTAERNRIVATARQMAEVRQSAWVTGPIVRACLSGRRPDEVFDLAAYALPNEIKGKKAKGIEEE